MHILGHLLLLILCLWVLTSEAVRKRPPIIKPIINVALGNRNEAKNTNKNVKGNVGNNQGGKSWQGGGTGNKKGKGGRGKFRTAVSYFVPAMGGRPDNGGNGYDNAQLRTAEYVQGIMNNYNGSTSVQTGVSDSEGGTGGVPLPGVPQVELEQYYVSDSEGGTGGAVPLSGVPQVELVQYYVSDREGGTGGGVPLSGVSQVELEPYYDQWGWNIEPSYLSIDSDTADNAHANVAQYIVEPEYELSVLPNYVLPAKPGEGIPWGYNPGLTWLHNSFGTGYQDYPTMVEAEYPFPEEEYLGTLLLVEHGEPGYDDEQTQLTEY